MNKQYGGYSKVSRHPIRISSQLQNVTDRDEIKGHYLDISNANLRALPSM